MSVPRRRQAVIDRRQRRGATKGEACSSTSPWTSGAFRNGSGTRRSSPHSNRLKAVKRCWSSRIFSSALARAPQFDERYGAGYTWTARQLGDGRWEAEIARHRRRCGVFADLEDAALADLYSHARQISVKRHQTIVEQGVNWPYAGIVQSGIVQAVLE